jgi:DNA-binding MarR family transcriptional regulator
MMMELINSLQADIMEHLGRFGFLAVSQFHVLTGKSVGYIREMLGSLSRRGYISSYRVEISYKVRAENIYFLTSLGKEFLQSHKNVFADDIKLPISKNPVVTKDYFHRFAFISVHIYLYIYLRDHQIPFNGFYAYFDKTGSVKYSNLVAKTRIPLEKTAFYIPDGVAKTDKALYLLEMYCDRDTKRIIAQLGTHARAIALGTPAKTFNLQVNPFVLSIFAHDGIKQAVTKRLQINEHFAPMSELFYFASIDDVKRDISTAFKTIKDNPLTII